ncbi:hypothetical protein ElyMa_000803300 [Elysia marginata]|uniref:SMB domain-containing protein n=1 Tax=Elysia marginata TaxID=1093978 RepID=A0AAV4GZ95_9GAST|nr:hypothetical protein ElyMa_000803300 [Elysia marginata]
MRFQFLSLFLDILQCFHVEGLDFVVNRPQPPEIMETLIGQTTDTVNKIPTSDFEMFNISTQTKETSETTEPFTVFLNHTVCLEEATNFVYQYQNNLCGAMDPESYLVLAKAKYTCEHRCARKPVYGRSQSECACDETCLLHGDCCGDFHAVCPEIYLKSKELYTKMEEPLSMCLETNFRVFNEFKHFRHEEVLYLTTKIPVHVIAFVHGDTPPFEAHTLEKYSSSFARYKAVDVSNGLVFNNLLDFIRLSQTKTRPFMLSKIVSLDCFGKEFEDSEIKRYSIMHVLKWCTPKVTEDSLSPFHRSCKFLEIIACFCSNGNIYKNHLHNVCMGPNISISTEFKYKLWNEDFKLLRQTIPINDKCSVVSIHESHYHTSLETESRVLPGDMTLTITPVLTNWDWFSVSSGAREPHGENHDQKRLADLMQRKDPDFIVEFSHTIERRLRCPRVRSYLSECVLEECADGAIITSSQLGYHKFHDGLSCMRPALVTAVQPPTSKTANICTCFRLVAALARLNLWETVVRDTTTSTCSLLLTSFEEEDRLSVPRTYPNTRTPHSPDLDLEPPPAQPRVSERLQEQLFQSETLCHDKENQEDILVCFYINRSSALGLIGGNPKQCFTLASVRPRGNLQQNSAVLSLDLNLVSVSAFPLACLLEMY